MARTWACERTLSFGQLCHDGRRRQLRLTQAGVEFVERRLARAQFLFAKCVQRCVDGSQVGVQVLRPLLDIEQTGHDLTLGGMMLEESKGCGAVMQVVVGSELAQRELGPVVLLNDLDCSGLVFDLDWHAAGYEIEPVY